MGNIVITIGRTFGSGGREIGKQLARSLGFAYYDKELLEEQARYSGISQDYLQTMDEKKPSIFFAPLPTAVVDNTTISENRVIQIQREVINLLAEKSSCIIVGRRADQLLRGRPNTYNIFISASMPYCIERVAKRDGLTKQESERKIIKMNHSRQAYYNYTGEGEWGKASNYHLCLDSGILGVQDAVKLIKIFVAQAEGKSN